MFADKVSVSYRGFQPTPITKEIIETLLDELIIEGPHLSKLKAKFAVEGEFAHVLYSGILEIHSGAGPFFIKAESSQIADLTHKLLKLSRRHFSKWKAKRIGGKANVQAAIEETY